MTTLAAGSSVTFGLSVDQTFELTTTDGTTGTISLDGPFGSPMQWSFGPARKNNWKPVSKGLSGALTLTCTAGSVSYTVGSSLFVTATTDAVNGAIGISAAGKDVRVDNLAYTSTVTAPPYRLACWGQERANGADADSPEVIGAARVTDIRSSYWVCAYRGDMILTADFGNHDGGTGTKAVDWNSTTRSQGKTFTALAEKAREIDAVLFNYGGTDIVGGNGTTPTAATVLGYLQANILAILRLGLPVIVESIYPYMDVAVYRGVTSGWTAYGSGTAAQKQAICDSVNSQLQTWCALFPNQVVFVDVATALKDGGTYASRKYMIDGIELNMRGCILVGELVAEASKAILPLRQSMYLGERGALTPNLINLIPGFTNYFGAAASQGTIAWGTPSIGFDGTYGPYFEVTATCSAITGLTPKNITSVTWSGGALTFTVASHAMMPTQNFTVSGLSGSIAGAMTGPFTVATNASETTFTVSYPSDPGTLTIAGSPPSASSQITVQEAFATMSVFTDVLRANGTPATGVSLRAGDMLQADAWVYADDGSGGIPPLDSLTLRQRFYYAAGTPTSIYSDGGIVGPTYGSTAFPGPLGPVRMHTTPMVSANTTSGASSNISNTSGSSLQVCPVFNAVGAARLRLYSPAIRVVRPGPIVIATPATTVPYTNTYPYPIRILVGLNGATITAATVNRGDANNLYTLGAGFLTGGEITLGTSDSLILTYTGGPPTMTGFVP